MRLRTQFSIQTQTEPQTSKKRFKDSREPKPLNDFQPRDTSRMYDSILTIKAKTMRLKPVPEISPPAYPTRNEFMAADHLPEGREARERHSDRSHWGKDLAGAAVFFLAISVGGGDTPTVSAAEIPPKHTVEQPAEYTAGQPVEPIVQIAVKNQSKGMTVVAPIFEHGSGHGYTGCIAVAPPSFLSEEEAMQVIKYELAKHGVKLGDGEELKDLIVQIPCHDRYGIGEREPKKQLPLSLPRPLAVDAIDKSKNIAVEIYLGK